jgi:hypothetical protein
MANYTLTYSDMVKGWVSFYSYRPDWIIGMNNFLYTFKGGNLYKHNVNDERNTFYKDWYERGGTGGLPFVASSLQSVFNTSPLENKLFKTINLEGDGIWSVVLQTDIQASGYIQADWFQKKEQSYFAFIRNNTAGQFDLRSTNGIGKPSALTTGTGFVTIDFSIDPLVQVGNIVSIGDYVYFFTNSNTVPKLAGAVSEINVDYPNDINNLKVDTTIGSTFPIPSTDAYILYVKNSVAESHGVLGHYCTFNISNDYNYKVELFAIESEIMKSFP